MEQEIEQLLNTSSLTEIMLTYDFIEKKINDYEKKIINLAENKEQSKEQSNEQSKEQSKEQSNEQSKEQYSEENIKKLQSLLDKTTDSNIKEMTMEELIKIYKQISKFCY
jgi:thiamine pyrophosphate-dependent acetolactate synthase large subunit-like protein